MNHPGLKPGVSRINDLKCLRFAPGGHSSPGLKARGFLADFIKLNSLEVFGLYKNTMLTRLEVLNELQRIGIKEPSLLKKYLEDFEQYMRTNHGLKITTTKTESEEEKFKEEIFKKISPLFK